MVPAGHRANALMQFLHEGSKKNWAMHGRLSIKLPSGRRQPTCERVDHASVNTAISDPERPGTHKERQMKTPTPTARRGVFSFWTGMQLWKQIFLALTAGLIIGVALNMSGNADIATNVKPVGDLFIRGIKMLIVPSDLRLAGHRGRIAARTCRPWDASASRPSSSIWQPPPSRSPSVSDSRCCSSRAYVDLGTAAAVSAKAAPTLTETIRAWCRPTSRPPSPRATCRRSSFAIFVGLAITPRATPPSRSAFDSGRRSDVQKLTSIIISFAPGVFALMVVAGAYGMDVLAPLAKVIALVYVGCVVPRGPGLMGLIVRRPPQPGALFPGRIGAGDGGLHQHLQLGHAAGHDDVGRA